MITSLALAFIFQTATFTSIIPAPKTAMPGGSTVVYPSITTISAEPDLKPIARVLAEEVKTAFNTTWKQETEPSGSIRLKLDKTMEPEAYNLAIGSHTTITGGSYRAVAMATVSLLQVLKPMGNGVSAPLLVVQDKPTFPYRGLLIDVARKYHSISTLKQIVEMCRFYKIRYLQLHLSDDQAFTFPSKAFPELTTMNQHGGPSYIREELDDLVNYADDRAVTIIPEIDMPGHCAALIRAKPELFKIAGTKPYEHHATINFANEKVLAAIDTIIGEVCDVFKSAPYFHMGGDEADIANVAQHADFKAAFQTLGLPENSQQELFRRFIGQVNEMVKKRGKSTMVWEGFGRDPNSKFPIPKDITVMEFENAYYLPSDLASDGYRLINASWTPLYVVNQHVWQPKKVYDWDISRFGKFSKTYPESVFMSANPKMIDGAQVCAWEQPEYLEITNLRRILPAMSERIWSPGTPQDFDIYTLRFEKTDALLTRLIQPVEFDPSGMKKLGPDDFDLPTFTKAAYVTLRSRWKGDIHYTIDGSKPTSASPVYQNSFKIDDTTTVRAIVTGDGMPTYESSMTFYKE